MNENIEEAREEEKKGIEECMLCPTAGYNIKNVFDENRGKRVKIIAEDTVVVHPYIIVDVPNIEEGENEREVIAKKYEFSRNVEKLLKEATENGNFVDVD